MISQVNPRRLATSILDRVFRSDSYADILLDNTFKKLEVAPRDRALTTELVYGTLRWLGWLDWILTQTYHGRWSKVPSTIRRALEVGLYQILFLDKVPDYAVVNETVKIVAEKGGREWSRVVNGLLRKILRTPGNFSPPPMEEDPVLAISVKWSHPRWLVRKWVELFGVDRTVSLCRANNERPNTGIRVNRLRTERKKVGEVLRRQNIEANPSELLEEFLTVERGGQLATSEPFRKGLFSIQDVSAGLVGRRLCRRTRRLWLGSNRMRSSSFGSGGGTIRSTSSDLICCRGPTPAAGCCFWRTAKPWTGCSGGTTSACLRRFR